MTASGTLEWRETPLHELRADEVSLRPLYGAIKHGTEFSMAKGTAFSRGPWNAQLQIHDPIQRCAPAEAPVGNMVAGEVIQAGRDAPGFFPGALVYGYAPFGDVVHMRYDRCWKLDDLSCWKTALCLDPARFALASLRDGNLRLGDTAAVFGLGAIGLLAVQMARLAGASRVFALDPVAERRKAAAGYAEVIDPSGTDAGRMIKEATGGRGVDAAIEVSGSAAALQQALRAAAFGGAVVCAAFPPPYPAGVDFGAEAHLNRPQIVFSRAVSDPNRDHPRWDARRIETCCRKLIAHRSITGEKIIDRVIEYQHLPEAFLQAMNNPSYAVKLGVTFH